MFFILFKILIEFFTHVRCCHTTYSNFRKFLRYNIRIIKLQLQPWWVTADDVKTIAEPEHFKELKHWVEEVIKVSKTFHNAETVNLTDAFTQFEHTFLMLCFIIQQFIECLCLDFTFFLCTVKHDLPLLWRKQIFLPIFASIREHHLYALFCVNIQHALNIVPILLTCR